MIAIRPLRSSLHGLMFMAAQAGRLTLLISGSRYRFAEQDSMIVRLLRASFAVFC